MFQGRSSSIPTTGGEIRETLRTAYRLSFSVYSIVLDSSIVSRRTCDTLFVSGLVHVFACDGDLTYVSKQRAAMYFECGILVYVLVVVSIHAHVCT